jgi:hypothetical protein
MKTTMNGTGTAASKLKARENRAGAKKATLEVSQVLGHRAATAAFVRTLTSRNLSSDTITAYGADVGDCRPSRRVIRWRRDRACQRDTPAGAAFLLARGRGPVLPPLLERHLRQEDPIGRRSPHSEFVHRVVSSFDAVGPDAHGMPVRT